MTKLKQIADEIAAVILPGNTVDEIAKREYLAGAIMELALEIKRATTEGE